MCSLLVPTPQSFSSFSHSLSLSMADSLNFGITKKVKMAYVPKSRAALGKISIPRHVYCFPNTEWKEGFVSNLDTFQALVAASQVNVVSSLVDGLRVRCGCRGGVRCRVVLSVCCLMGMYNTWDSSKRMATEARKKSAGFATGDPCQLRALETICPAVAVSVALWNGDRGCSGRS